MKKIILAVAVIIITLLSVFTFSGCSSNSDYVANGLESAQVEEFGLCVGKNSSKKSEIIGAMNKVILSLDISEAVEYYNDLALGKTPEVRVKEADLSSCNGGTLKVYTCSGFEPYEFLNSAGEIIGVDIWLMSHVCKELNMQMQVIDMDFDGIVAKVKTEDNAVGAAGITIDEERKQSVEFSIPYYSSVQYLISQKDSAFTSFSQIQGLTVGVQKGTTGALLAYENQSEYSLTVKEYNSAAEAFSAVKAGKCNVIMLDSLPAIKLVSTKSQSFFQTLIKTGEWKWYFEGVFETLLISLGAVLIGCAIGIIIGFIKYLNKKYAVLKVTSRVCDIYLTIIRGTPVYLQLLIMAFVVLATAREVWIAILTFGINSGAYVAEIIRSGLEGVDDGQLEAGSSLGLSRFTVMKSIVFPQAVRRTLPPLCNEFIALIKETSIVGVIGIVDVTKVASRIVSKTYEPFLPYLISAGLYLILVVGLTLALKFLERRLAKSDRT